MKKLLALFTPSVSTLVRGLAGAVTALDAAAARETARTERALQEASACVERANGHRRAANTARKTSTALQDLLG